MEAIRVGAIPKKIFRLSLQSVIVQIIRILLTNTKSSQKRRRIVADVYRAIHQKIHSFNWILSQLKCEVD